MTIEKYIAMCPSCSVRLPLDDEHFAAARGKIQCGECGTIFHAPDNLLKGVYLPKQHRKTQKSDTSTTVNAPDLSPKSIETNESTTEPLLFDFVNETENEELITSKPAKKHVAQKTKAPHVHAKPSVNTKPIEDEKNASSQMHAAEITTQSSNRGKKSKRSVYSRVQVATQSKETSHLFWILPLALTLAVLVLITQIFIVNQKSWSQDTNLRGLYSYFCKATGCQLRNVTPVAMQIGATEHVEYKQNMFYIRSFILNDAWYEQPLPILLVQFFEPGKNELITQRTIGPENYLLSSGKQLNTIKPGQSLPVALYLKIEHLSDKKHVPQLRLFTYSD